MDPGSGAAGHVTIVGADTVGFYISGFPRDTCCVHRLCGNNITVVGTPQIVDNAVNAVGIVQADNTADAAVVLCGFGGQVPVVHAVGHRNRCILEIEETDNTAETAVFRFDRRIVGATGNRHTTLGTCHDTADLMFRVIVKHVDGARISAVLDRRITGHFTDKTAGGTCLRINVDGGVAVPDRTALQQLYERAGLGAAPEKSITAVQVQVLDGSCHGRKERTGTIETCKRVIDPVTVTVKGTRESAGDLTIRVCRGLIQQIINRETGLRIRIIEFYVEVNVPGQYVGFGEERRIAFQLRLKITELRYVLNLVRIFSRTVTAGELRRGFGAGHRPVGERPVLILIRSRIGCRCRKRNGHKATHDQQQRQNHTYNLADMFHC